MCYGSILLFIDVIITLTSGLQPGVGVLPGVRQYILGGARKHLKGYVKLKKC
jgi:hypothetical protein